MPDHKCEEVLNIETISNAFQHRRTQLTNRIQDCLYRCFKADCIKWAIITYSVYPSKKIIEIADLAFTDSIFKLAEKAKQGSLYDGKAVLKTVFHRFFHFQVFLICKKNTV